MMPRDRLTAKEIQIADLVGQGLTNREIGKMIGTTGQVIKNHLRGTFDKRGVWNRLALAMVCRELRRKGWLEDSDCPGCSLNRAAASRCWSAALTFNQRPYAGDNRGRGLLFPHGISNAYGTAVRTNRGTTKGLSSAKGLPLIDLVLNPGAVSY
jgi:DNA-binding CsgD family transcriptional regulator